MSKGPEAFRTISEVAEELNVPQHVLRFWETRFTQIKPVKRAGGRRFYRPDDVALLVGIRHLLYGAGYTIRGVQRILKEKGVAHVQSLVPSPAYDSDASVAIVSQALEIHEAPIQRSLFHESEFSKRSLPNIDAAALDLSDAKSVYSEDESFGHDEGMGNIALSDDYEVSPTAQSDASSHSYIDARAATVSAAYTALTPASMPLHPRDGFIAVEDFQKRQAEERETISDGCASARYAPGPLAAGMKAARQPSRISSQSDNPDKDETDHIIQPQYRLTTGTRESLLTVLEELRECRRLLGGALVRQLD